MGARETPGVAVMSALERWACVNPAWRAFTARAVIPWVFGSEELAGEVLEIGTGAGANAAALLRRHPQARVTATDVDPAMLDSARARLAPFGDRARVAPGDARALDFGDDSFDVVVSLLMLHHVGDRPSALAEGARVLRQRGRLLGYDLTRSGPAAWLHRRRSAEHDLATADELRTELAGAGFVDVHVDRAFGGLVARFSASVP
jgi:SAM-dependent methyltransferase